MILRYEDYGAEHDFETEVVVVGTGAGGAVVGTELAEAGHQVLFVEEGSYEPTESFSPYVTDGVARLYRDAGTTLILGTPPISYVEGRCVGGSTVINGGMTYRPPERALAAWQRQTGSAELGPAALEPLFERVERRLSASHQSEASLGRDNRLMAEGAARMGWQSSVNRRAQHHCVGSNNCVLGCPTGAKQSTLVSYLPSSFRAGARCLTELRVERLLIERGRCVGVEGHAIEPSTRQRGPKVRVRARATIIAGGAVQTPTLLLREGLGRGSPGLGANFLCHPNAKVLAVYPFDVEGWKGVSQATQIREFLDDGILMAENFVPPAALAAHLRQGGAEAWELMRRYRQMVLSGVLVEDSSTGRVGRGFAGVPRVRYDVTAHDHERFVRGVRHLAELHFAMGAEEVHLPFATHPVVRSVDAVRALDVAQIPRSGLELFTVHLMGTARMGVDPKRSVVGLDGQLWALPGCHVADASLFPGAIGVNPQVTIMALATRVAERLSERLARAA